MAYMAAHDTGGFSATGRFGGTVDFDPGPGETLLTNPAPPYSGDVDMAVARFTDSGELLWARRIGDDEPTNTQMDTGVATDRLGNTYVLGIFQYSVDLGGQTLTGDYSDGFIAKLDPNGDFLWSQPLRAEQLEDRPPETCTGLRSMTATPTPPTGRCLSAAFSSGTATLGGQTFRSAKNSYDGFVSKLSSASGAFQWTQVITGSGTQHPFARQLPTGRRRSVRVRRVWYRGQGRQRDGDGRQLFSGETQPYERLDRLGQDSGRGLRVRIDRGDRQRHCGRRQVLGNARF